MYHNTQSYNTHIIIHMVELIQIFDLSSNNKTLNARLLARVITGCHYT